MTEAQFQKRLTDLCDWLGLKWHHETDSRKSKAGFPDLVIAGNAVVFAELKAETGRIEPEQTKWANALARAGAEVHIWRPSDWDLIERRLRLLAFTSVPTGGNE